MPTYAYGCDKCGVRFDRYQSFDDPPLTECPECGEEALRRLILPVGVVFKGSGFYSTDHRSPSGQGSPRKPDEGESGSKDNGAKDSGDKASGAKDRGDEASGTKDSGDKANSGKKEAAAESAD